MTRQLTAIIEREGDGYVVQCLEANVATLGASVAGGVSLWENPAVLRVTVLAGTCRPEE